VDISLNTDGPHSPEYTRQVAEAIAEAARVLNHATGNYAGEALEFASDVDSVIQSLATMAQRLPQLLDQLTDQLHQREADGLLAVGYGQFAGHPVRAVLMVETWLEDAKEAAGTLYEALNSARQVTSTLSAAEGC
jgi:hypothetical protein